MKKDKRGREYDPKEVGYGKPPKSSQFGQPNGNPVSTTFWKKADSPRFKLENLIKMSLAELEEIAKNDERPLFERKMARAIAEGGWKEMREMIHEVYGMPKQTIEQTTRQFEIKINFDDEFSKKEIIDGEE